MAHPLTERSMTVPVSVTSPSGVSATNRTLPLTDTRGWRRRWSIEPSGFASAGSAMPMSSGVLSVRLSRWRSSPEEPHVRLGALARYRGSLSPGGSVCIVLHKFTSGGGGHASQGLAGQLGGDRGGGVRDRHERWCDRGQAGPVAVADAGAAPFA